jgi:NADPH:quinone reductase-like Zn-dependent oxidoreductase
MRAIFTIMIFGDRQVKLLMHKPNKGLEDMTDLFESGKIKPVIDQVFPLDKSAEAFRYFGTGKVKGKVVIATT